ncbi:MAG: TetR/AcrR family transcriptional regulator [Anaeromicrobium sp.]|uniref:TetR/AcrR family transcriptional regulator n=1 Tax=Anaeromicrobium sp. TaxID=1929132 RepID=UPI0026015E9F|nr:TetR/AcrR family transcriptional regulator [Anaeromicrobium sp.]MCT4594791.1 TetR/AcrR family transcriptional regulator [Anaeromicrobium sp.]
MKDGNRKKRIDVMGQFIDTAFRIAQKESFTSISVRRLAKDTNYNSSTLYYYFKSFENLMAYVSLKYLGGFYKEQWLIEETYINSTDRYIRTWELFIKYAIKYPNQFNMLIFGKCSKDLEEIFKTYSEIYPNEQVLDYSLFPIFRNRDNHCEIPLLDQCIGHGYVKSKSKTKIIELMESILKTLIEKAIDTVDETTLEDLAKRNNEYVRMFLSHYQTPIGIITFQEY